MEQKIRKIFSFLLQLHLNRREIFSQSRTGYLPLEVNVLPNTAKYLHMAKGDISQTALPNIPGKV